MSEILSECLPAQPVAVLSGPSHAEEVVRKMPTAVVVGCTIDSIAQRLQAAVFQPRFPRYTNSDVAAWSSAAL
jgi:glycerol-3-phosphate dehydrogenase (NAD(P)+)